MKNDPRCSQAARPCLSGVFPAERGRVVRAHVVAGRAATSTGVGAVPNDAIVAQSVCPSVRGSIKAILNECSN